MYGVWSILPSCTGEIPPPASLPAEMKKNGISALTLNPLANRFLPCSAVIGDYLEMAQERAIPVLLNTGRGLAIESAECLMREFRQLTAILTFDNCWPSDRLLRPFLEEYPNLCLDMTYVQTAGGLPDIVKKYTARRILFGSGYPECYMGAHMMVIKHAPISEADRELVAGGNLKRILGEARYD
jgi:predicted TIM-barrel fold metal-dependent hydrolase